MDNIAVESINDIRVVGFDIYIVNEQGEETLFKDGLISVAKGELELAVDGKPISITDVVAIGKDNVLEKIENVFLEDAISSKSQNTEKDDDVEQWQEDATAEDSEEELELTEDEIAAAADAREELLALELERLEDLKEALKQREKELEEKSKDLKEEVEKNERELEGQGREDQVDVAAYEELLDQIEALEQIQEQIDVEVEAAVEQLAEAEKDKSPEVEEAKPVIPKPIVEEVTAGTSSSSSSASKTEDEESADEVIEIEPLTLEMSLSRASDSGASGDFITNVNSSLVFQGTTLPGASVSVNLDGTILTTSVADTAGVWSTTSVGTLLDGEYTVTATATDGTGQTTVVTKTLVIDTVAPDAPIGGLDLDSDTGLSNEDGITSNNLPTFIGTAEAGTTIELQVDGQTFSELVDADGNWTIVVDSELADGILDYSLTANDTAGNVSDSLDGILTVDTIAELTGGVDVISDTGRFNDDGITSETQPLFSGTSEAGLTIELALDGQIYNTVVATDGTWQIGPVDVLAENVHAYSLSTTDIAGNEALIENTVTVDTTAPTLLTGDLDTASDTGLSDSDDITNDNTPTFSGTGEVNDQITLTIAGDTYTTIVAGDGTWNVTASNPISDSTSVTYSISAEDLAGNVIASPVTGSIVVDTVIVLTERLDELSDSGSSDSDQITNDVTPTFSGTGDAGASVELTLNNQVYTATVDGGGAWTVNVTAVLTDGDYTYTVASEDIAGNTASLTNSVTIDTTTTVTGGLDSSSDSGVSDSDDITNDSTPKFSGTGEAGAEVSVAIDGQTYTAIVDVSGQWTAEVTSTLADANHAYTITAVDVAGNTAFTSGSIEIDTTIPNPFTGGLDVGSNSGALTDTITNDTQPEFSGTGEDGTTVVLELDGATYNTSVAGGVWSIDVTDVLTDGLKPYTLTSTDIAGNDAELTGDITIDTVAEITGGLDVTSDSGIEGDNVTNDASPKFSGTSEPGSTVELSISGSSYSATVDAAGVWFVDLAITLAETTHPFVITSTDVAGNTGSVEGTVVVDTTAPTPFTGGLDASSDSGEFDTDGVTSVTNPAFTGSGEVGATVTVTIDGEEYVGTVGSDGNWVVTVSSALPDGDYTYELVSADLAGNTSPTITNAITVDTTAPTPFTARLDEASDAGSDNSDGITSVVQPVISGTGEVGAKVTVNINNTNYQDVVAANGTWAIQVTTDLPEGTHSYTSTAEDLAGNSVSLTNEIVIDLTLSLTGGLDASSDTGVSNSDGITSDTTPKFSGTTDPGVDVSLEINGTTLTTISGADGNWIIDVTNTLADANYPYTISAQDLAGNNLVRTGDITVDTTAPTPFSGGLDAASDSGNNTDDITNINAPTFSGLGEAGAVLTLSINNKSYSGTVAGNGTWDITIPSGDPLPDGVRTYSIAAEDLAGNIVTLNDQVTIDTSTTITVALDAASDTGVSNSDGITQTTSPTFVGQAEVGASISLEIGGQTYSTTVNAGGNWNIDVTGILPEAIHTYLVTATDIAANIATASGQITVDTSIVFTGGLDAASDSGTSNSDSITNDNTPTFSGTGEEGATVVVNINSSNYNSVVDANGLWSITVTGAVPDGNQLYTLTSTDIAGNTTNLSGNVDVDTSISLAGGLDAASDSGSSDIDGVTNVTNPDFKGTGDAGDAIVVTINGGAYSTTVDANGNWTVNVNNVLPEANHDYTIVASDVAGNSRTLTGVVTVDTTVPVFTGSLDSTSDSGISSTDGITSDNLPTFTGTGDVGLNIVLNVNSRNYSGVVGTDGTWRIDVTDSISDGSFSYQLRAEDLAGNVSLLTGDIRVDTVTVVTGGLASSDDTGDSDSDNITNITTPEFKGTSELGAVISLAIGGQTYTDVADINGNWSIDVANTLLDGDYAYNITAVDLAGNTDSTSGSITVDATAPTPFTGSLDASSDSGVLNSDGITNDTTPTFSGTVEVGVSVVLNINNTNYNATVDAAGNWQIDVGTPLPEGIFAYTLTATDVAGNDAVITDQVTIDTHVNVTGSLAATSDMGDSNNDGITNVIQPTFSGTTEADAVVDLLIEGNTYSTIADASGNWSVDVTNNLPEGILAYTITATDIAGNTGTDSGNIEIDITLPTPFTGRLDSASDSGSSDSDTITSETTPTFTGTGEVGATVTLNINNTDYATTVLANGTWAVTINALPDGVRPYTLVTHDVAGNEATLSGQITVDTVTSFTGGLDTASDSGTDNSDGLTNNTTPTFSGTGEVGANIALEIDQVIYNGTVDAAGNWSVDVTNALADNNYVYSLLATDLAGNTATLGGSVIIDTVAQLTGGLDTSSDSGTNTSDSITNDNTPLFSGTGEEGATIALTINNGVYNTTVAANGTWSVNVTGTLPDGDLAYSIETNDNAGNTTTLPGQITVDTVTSLTGGLDAGSDSGDSDSDNQTNVVSPTFSGIAEAGATVVVEINGSTYSAIAIADGSWSVNVTAVLPEADHGYTILSTDIAGNTASLAGTITVDTSVNVTGGLSASSDTGISNSDGLTNQTNPEFSGTGEVGAHIALEINNITYQTTVAANGEWAVTVANTLPEGTLAYEIAVEDIVGNTTTLNGNIVVDTSTIIVGSLATASDTGSSNIDGNTQVTMPIFEGTGEPGAEVSLVIDGTTYTTTVLGDNSWSVTVGTALADASYNYTLTAVDEAGNTADTTGTLVVDTTVPSPLTGGLDVASDSGATGDNLTNEALPTFSGTSEANVAITLSINSQNYVTTSDAGGNWSVNVTQGLPEANLPYTITAEDLAGNTSAITSSIDVDLHAELTGGLSTASDSGDNANDQITNITTPDFNGTGEAGASISLEINNVTYTTTVAANGNWLVNVGTALTEASHNYTITTVDLADNTATVTGSVLVDTSAPTPFSGGLDAGSDSGVLSDDGITQENQPTFSGLGEPGAEVTLAINGVEYSAVVDVTGEWTVDVTNTLPDTVDLAYDLTLEDTAGNTTPINGVITVDTTAPAVTGGLSLASDSGNIGDNITNIVAPDFNGTAEVGAAIEFVINGVTYNTVADAGGLWSVNVSPDLLEGAHPYTITATDTAGNETVIADNLLVDLSAAITGGLDSASDSGDSDSDGITNIPSPVFSGTGEEDMVVTLTIDGNDYTTLATVGDVWSLTLPVGLVDGDYAYSIVGTDAAGNPATDGAGNLAILTGNVTIDTVTTVDGSVDAASDTGSSNSDEVTNNVNPNFSGVGETGATVTLVVEGSTYTTVINGAGIWIINATAALSEGTHNYTVTSVDIAGNSAIDTGSITIDTTAPTQVTGGLDASNDTGILGDGKTNISIPLFTGEGEVGSDIELTIGGQVYNAIVDGSGDWSINVTTSLSDATHGYTIVSSDLAGNTSNLAGSIVVDSTTTVTGGLDAGSDTGSSNSDGITQTTSPTFSGTGEVNATIQVLIGGSTYNTTVDANGDWDVDVSAILVDATYPFTITAIDEAGNTDNTTGQITVDATTFITGGLDSLSDSGSFSDDDITNDTDPTFSGTGEVDAVIRLEIAGQVYTTTVPISGAWSVDVTNVLINADHAYTLTATDVAGNTATESGIVTIDTVASITGGLDVSSDTGSSTNDDLTKDSQPLFSGTAEPGSSISLLINTETYTATTSAAGVWSVASANVLPDGDHNYTVTTVDIAGNTADITGTITVDTVIPTTLTGGLHASSDSGRLQDDDITNDTTPTFHGTGEVGAEIQLDINSTTYTTTVAGDGNWSINATTALPHAIHAYTITETDPAGNERSLSDTVNIDTTIPTPFTGGLSSASDSGDSQNDDLTNVINPFFSGTGEADAIIVLTIDNNNYQTTVVGGLWSIQVTNDLSAGSEAYTLVATDIAGNEATLTGTIVVDLTTTVTGGLDATSDTGISNSDDLTNDSTPLFSGTGEIGAEVVIAIGGSSYTTTVDGVGNWSVNVGTPTPLVDGNRNYTITATDIAGNEATASGTIVVDTLAPVFTGRLDSGSDTGDSDSDRVTQDNQPTFSGTGEVGMTVSLDINGATYTSIVDAAGNWEIDVTVVLLDNDYAYVLTTFDDAGNESILSNTITIDTAVPTALVGGLDEASDSGTLNVDGLTNDTTPTFSGTGEANSTITLLINNVTYTTTVAGDQTWSVTAGTALADSDYPYTITSTDLAGNAVSISDSITIDTVAALTGGLDATSDSGSSSSDDLTNNTTPLFSGTGEVDTTIALAIAGEIYNTVVDANGDWSVLVTDILTEAPHNYTITAVDYAGNTAITADVNGTIVVDISAPTPFTGDLAASSDSAIDSDHLTNDTTPTFTGTGEVGAEVRVEIDGTSYTSTVAANNTWSVTVTGTLADAVYAYNLISTDPAGNTALLTGNVEIDTVTTVTGGLDDSSDTGVSQVDDLTNDTTPLFSGTGENGAEISLHMDGGAGGGGATYTTTVIGGVWSVNVATALSDGAHPYQIDTVDIAGNTDSTSGSIEVDTSVPTPFTGSLDSGSDTGATDSDQITQETMPVFTGTGEVGAKVDLLIDGETYTATVGIDNNWTINATTALSDDNYTYTLRSTDDAGNFIDIVDTLVVDTTDPVVLTGGLSSSSDSGDSNSDDLTNEDEPDFNGTGDEGAEIVLSINGNTYTTTVAGGVWSLNVSDELVDGTYAYTITETDLAGNDVNITGSITVDSSNVLTARLDASSDTGISSSDTLTNDATPLISGTGEAGAHISVTFGANVYTTDVLADNSWSVTATVGLGEGLQTYNVVSTDIAGNVVSVIGNSITVDTTDSALTGDLSTASDTGEFNTDGITQVTTPTFNGTGETGDAIKLTIGGEEYTATVVAGVWSIDVTNALTDGSKPYTITATDDAGNVTTVPGNIVVDTAAPTPFGGGLDDASDSGSLDDDNLTNDTTPLFSGIGEPNAVVTLDINSETYTTTVSAAGEWSVAVPGGDALTTDTNYIYTLTETDLAGNTAILSGSIDVDTTTTVTGGVDATSDSGILNSDNVTNDTTPLFTGTGEVGAAISVAITTGGSTDTYTTTVGAGGTWSVNATTPLSDGNHPYTITATDIAGNVDSVTSSVDIDTQAPSPFTGRLTNTSDTGNDDSDTITNELQPSFNGTGENGTTVTLTINSLPYTAVVAGGTWSIDVIDNLPAGIQAYTLESEDTAGNISTITGDIEIDVSTAVTGGLATVSDTGHSNSDDITKILSPTFSGTAEEGATVVLAIDGQSLTQVVGALGTWSIDPAALTEGNNQAYTITSTDIAGNVAVSSGQIDIDTTAPPVAGGLDAASDSGVAADDLTFDVSPTFSGTGENGNNITVVINARSYTTTVVGGIWDVTVSDVDLLDGNNYPYTITAEDVAGNETQVSGAIDIDTSTFLTGRLSAASDSGLSDSDRYTNDTNPVFSGTAEEGSTVTLTINSLDYTQVVGADELWSLTVVPALASGTNTYSYQITTEDIAGNTQQLNSNITVDTENPSPFSGRIKASDDTGILNTDDETMDTTPDFTGSGEEGALVEVTIGGVTYDAIVGAGGLWTVSVTAPLLDGDRAYTLRQTDQAGNFVELFGTLDIDTVGPALTGGLDDSSDTADDSDNITFDDEPLFTGTTESTAAVTLLIGGQTVLATVDGGGNWDATVPIALADGTQNYTITSTDIAGNETVVTGSIVVDTSTVITARLKDTSDSGILDNDGNTNDSTPTFVGTGEVGATISFTLNGVPHTTTVDAAGNWEVDHAVALPDNSYTFTVTSTDIAGNTDTESITIIIDTAAPTPFTGDLDDASDTGIDQDDRLTNDNTPLFTGTGENGTVVSLVINGATYTDTVAGGVWAITASPALVDGAYNFSLTETDTAGNITTLPDRIVTIDTQISLVGAVDSADDSGRSASDQITNDSSPFFSGTGEPGASIEVVIAGAGGGTYTTTVIGDGSWTVEATGLLAEGVHAYTINTSDDAGNTDIINSSINVDLTAPNAPVGGLDEGSDTGSSNNDDVTNNTLPTFSGTAEANSDVIVTIGGHSYVTRTSAAGEWSLLVTDALTDGPQAYDITATDIAGNVSALTSGSITVDTDDPDLLNVDMFDAGASSVADWTTRFDTVNMTVEGDTEANTTVRITVGANATVTQTSDAAGNFTFNLPHLAEGTHTVTVEAEDLAGNVDTYTKNIIVDLSVLLTGYLIAASDTGEFDNDEVTFDNTPTFEGTTDPNATVSLTFGGAATTVVADALGAWSITMPTQADATYNYTISAVDPLGNDTNVNGNNVTGIIIIDTGAPPVTGTLDDSTDTAPLGDGVTTDQDLRFTGTGEAVAKITLVMTHVSSGDVTTFDTVVDGLGEWLIDTTTMDFGVYDYVITTEDLAGNLRSLASQEVIVQPENLDLSIALIDGHDTGTIEDDGWTSINAPTVEGVGTPGALITIEIKDLDNAEAVVGTYTTTSSPIGDWSIIIATVLVDGNYRIDATSLKDAVTDTESMPLIIDTVNTLTHALTEEVDDETNASTVEIAGVTDPGARVTVTINAQDYAVSANAAGVYTIAVPSLTEGTFNYFITSVDGAGNIAGGDGVETGTFTVDRTAPVLTGDLAAASDSGPSDSDGITNDDTPTFEGTVTGVYDRVYILMNGVEYDITPIGDGSWSYTMSPALADGFYNYSIFAFDKAGNFSRINDSIRVKTDIEFTATLQNDTGSLSTDFITSDGTLVFVGLSDPDNAIEARIYDSVGTLLETLNLNAGNTGTYSAAFTGPLAEGVYRAEFDVSDLAGNSLSHTIEDVTVDTSSTALTLELDTASDTGLLNDDDNTMFSNPTFVGTGDPGARVVVDVTNDAGDAITSLVAFVGNSGDWSISLNGLVEDSYTITANSTDVAGNASAELTYDFDVLLTPPTLTWEIQQDINDDGIINEAEYAAGGAGPAGTLTINGTGDPTNVVTFLLNGQEFSTTVAGDGNWSITTPQIPDFDYDFTLQSEDIAGNITTINDSILIDSGITMSLYMQQSSDTHWKLDQITSVQDPVFSMVTEFENSIVMTLTGSLGYTYTETITASANVISWQPPVLLVDDTYTLTAAASDAAGNTETGSTNFRIDTVVAEQPAPTFNTGSHGDTIDGLTYFTSARNFNIKGDYADTDISTTNLIIDGQNIRATNVAGGYQVSLPTALANGIYNFTVRFVDRAGNVDEFDGIADIKHGIVGFTSDIVGYNLQDGIEYGQGGIITFSGTSEVDARAYVSIDGTVYDTITDAAGNWSIDVAGIGQGTYLTRIGSTDKWGNHTWGDHVIAADTQAPFLVYEAVDDLDGTSDVLWDSLSGDLTGETDYNAVLTITVNGGAATTITIGNDGTWTHSLAGLNEGVNNIVLTSTDFAGNITTRTFDVVTDTGTVVTGGLDAASDTAALDDITSEQTPTFSGTGEDGATISVLIDSVTTTTTVAGGVWSLTTSNTVGVGPQPYTITATDLVGNTDDISGSITIDIATVVAGGLDAASDTAALDNITSDTTPTFTGTAEAGASVSLAIAGGPYTAIADGSGDWSIAVITALPDGVNGYVITSTDIAGNTDSTSGSITIDAVAPDLTDTGLTDATDTGMDNSDNITSNASPTFEGVGEIGASINLNIDSGDYTTTVLANGTWSVMVGHVLDGTAAGGTDHNYTVTETAISGLTSTTSGTITVDTVDPGASLLGDFTTADTTPDFTGTGTLAAEVGSEVEITIGANSYTDTVDGSGDWSVNAANALTSGAHAYHVTITDVAGNTTDEDHTVTIL